MLPNLEPYAFAFKESHGGNMPWSADLLHLAQLWEAVAATRPYRIVEVGSYQGASACLWMEALNEGICREVHLFEIKPTPSLLQVIAMCKRPEQVVLHQQSYYEFPLHADFIFIDADHGWGALADLAAALATDCETIAMHDTTGFIKVPLADCWGSYIAANILRQAHGRLIFEDSKKRPGMHTERGLIIARHEGY
jgi:hypothetical protein